MIFPLPLPLPPPEFLDDSEAGAIAKMTIFQAASAIFEMEEDVESLIERR